MTQTDSLVIEFGDDRCRNVYWPPLDRRFRGRFDAQQIARHDRDAGELISQWPEPVAGQQLAIEADGTVAVIEPLHAFPAIEARLKQRNLRLAPAREIVKVDTATALYFCKAAVEAGQARVVRGTLPASIDETNVRKSFLVQPPPDPQATLAAAITAQTKAFDRLADVLEKALTAKR